MLQLPSDESPPATLVLATAIMIALALLVAFAIFTLPTTP